MKLQTPTRRAIGMIATLLLLTCLVPAEAISSFGRTTAGTIPSGGLRVDFKRGSKVVLSERGVLLRMCAYLDGNGGGTGFQTMRFALYRDRNGVPAEQVLESDSGADTGVEAFQQPTWRCSETARAPLDPGTYWVMIHTGGNPGVIRYYYDGPANWYGNSDPFADGASDTFGTGAAGEGTISIRAEYLTESEIRVAGPRNVGTRVSSPMSAQMKRGSSFVLTEQASLVSLNAYMDGFGGTDGSQPVSIAVYEEVQGEPSTLVAWGHVTTGSVDGGRTARWVSAIGIQGNHWLMPGRYWIVLQTGGPAGVLRYYMEGTGNWRGNANPGADPSPLFGAGNAGDGTISAHILYTPQPFVYSTFGRTIPGTIPSGALTANYIRGSQFYPDQDFVSGRLTALWAYLDGNGGASGSQKMRLALYKGVFLDAQVNRLTYSDEVTIPAGTPPGWVRFAVPDTYISYGPAENSGNFHIMLFSGGTQGVARYYSSNDGDNWAGAPVPYGGAAPKVMYINEGPSPGAIALSLGTRTMSVYAEYLNTDDLPRP